MSAPQGSGTKHTRFVESILAERLNFAYLSANKVFASDISITNLSASQQVPISIYFSADTVGILSYTIDGTNFVALNNGGSLNANVAYVFTVFLSNSDTFNLKFSEDALLNWARIGQQV